jgi:hypothetical protein
MRLSRRRVLRGVGGAMMALPLLESTQRAASAAPGDDTFAIFFREANGVACAQSTKYGDEPERFWPTQTGVLSAATVNGRALDELTSYLNKLLVVRVDTSNYRLGCGHARGAVQALTGTNATIPDSGSTALANGESIDHRIGRALNPGARDSLFLYAGRNPGFLGGSCISYRGPAQRRAPFTNPFLAFRFVTGGGGNAAKDKSLNDLVRDSLRVALADSALSTADRQKLDLHFSSVRDLEINLACTLEEDQARIIETGSGVFESDAGEDRMRIAELHMDVAVLAVACGQNRSVAIQVGSGNDGNTRFLDPVTGQRMENFHFVSHRIYSDGSSGDPMPNADLLHHYIDRYFAKSFKHLLDRLSAYSMPAGGTLLDAGISIWMNDLGSGPGHSSDNVPWIIAGSAGGMLKQGQYIIPAPGPSPVTHPRLLSTLGAAVGVRNAAGAPLDDFGDPTLPKGHLTELWA